jgi:hypothetical protein
MVPYDQLMIYKQAYDLRSEAIHADVKRRIASLRSQ